MSLNFSSCSLRTYKGEQEVDTGPAAMSPAFYKVQFKISLSPSADFLVTNQDLYGTWLGSAGSTTARPNEHSFWKPHGEARHARQKVV